MNAVHNAVSNVKGEGQYSPAHESTTEQASPRQHSTSPQQDRIREDRKGNDMKG